MRWLKLPDINGIIITINIEAIGAIYPAQREKQSKVLSMSGKEKNGPPELEEDSTRCNILISGYVLSIQCGAALVQTLVDQALLQQNNKDAPKIEQIKM